MTDQDNLRDRIAQTLYNHDVHTDYPGEPWVPDYYDANNRMRPEYEARAQAIIDDLGLGVQACRTFSSADYSPFRETRVVGRWERE